ncbi:diguanylate cyclase [Parendozoicomonas haliclonae]|uniref:diguanylate cyclase n=1 Tax=Parendozoicomonas haliclonae TaxID=1960125 RepID=UPI0039EE912E
MKWAFQILMLVSGCLALLVYGSQSEETAWVFETNAGRFRLYGSEIEMMALGMVIALAVYNFCIFVRALKRSYFEYFLYSLLAGLYIAAVGYEREIGQPLVILGGVFASQLILLLMVLSVIQFQLSLLHFQFRQTLEWNPRIVSIWLVVALCVLISANIAGITLVDAGWINALVIALSGLFITACLYLMYKGYEHASYLVVGWLALGFGFLGQEVRGMTFFEAFDVYLQLTVPVGLVVQVIANSLALSAFTNERFRHYQQGYVLLENNLQREQNQRRVYNDAVRQYLHNIPSMDEQTVGTRLLEVLNNLLPIDSSVVIAWREGKLKVISLTFSSKVIYERIVEGQDSQLENIARQGQITSLPPSPENMSVGTINLVPVYWDSQSWILVAMQPSIGNNLKAAELQLCLDISNHACTLFMASSNFRKLQHEADMDGLTGMYNRRAFMRESASVVHRLREDHQNFSLLYMDIDQFKILNDSYGHAFGDHVLKQFAEVCRDNLRDRDLLARPGGEEFLALLPKADVNTAFVVAERIRKGLAELQFTELGTGYVTVSIGVSDSATHGYDIPHLMGKADRALYRAKANGRNRTVVNDGDMTLSRL